MLARYVVSLLLAAPAIALGSLCSYAQANHHDYSLKVNCSTAEATPIVVASVSNRNQSADVPMLSFLPKYFSPKTAEQQCQMTASTLQALYNSGEVSYLASDTLDGQPLICAVERRGIGCDSYRSQVLFPFDKTVDPSQALYDMLGDRFKQAQPPDTRTVSRIYTQIDIRGSWWPLK